VLRVWASILLAVPRSRLVLKNRPFACASVQEMYWRTFEQAGVDRTRVIEGTGRTLTALPAHMLGLNRSGPLFSSTTQCQLTNPSSPDPAPQVDLLPLTPTNRQHLAQYSLVDISLDPWPYAGTTTTAESLFMGASVGVWGGQYVFFRVPESPPSPQQ
jgi:predicted O-linked N-acetylglucosamine transferase (SPINDLY family)